jgi:hypothetical protein
MKQYWTQVKAPAGNWFDSLGTDELAGAISFAKFEVEQGNTARVVSRTDIVVWDESQL